MLKIVLEFWGTILRFNTSIPWREIKLARDEANLPTPGLKTLKCDVNVCFFSIEPGSTQQSTTAKQAAEEEITKLNW